MPRNAAKRSNKNTKRLPVLVKLTVNKRNRRTNKKNKNNNKNKNTTIQKNKNSNKQQSQQQQLGQRANKANGTERCVEINQISTTNDNCDVNSTITTQTTTLSLSLTKSHRKSRNNKVTTKLPSQTTPPHTTDRQKENTSATPQLRRHSVSLKYCPNTSNFEISTQSVEEEQEKVITVSNYVQSTQSANTKFNNSNNIGTNNKHNSNIACNNDDTATKEKVLTATATLTYSSSSSVVASSLSFPSSSSSSPHHRVSTLYPIVIETHISEAQSCLPGDLNKAATLSSATVASTYTEAATTTKHSISFNVACCNPKAEAEAAATTTTAAEATATYKTTTSTTATNTSTTTAADTLLEHQKHQQQQQQQQQKLQKKNVSQQRNHRKRRHFHHPQEVKARLATLRTRKVIVANDKTEQKGHNNNNNTEQEKSPERIPIAKESITKEIISGSEGKEKSRQDSAAATSFCRRAFPQLFDEATLNRIETLSDNEVKKPNNKRKRNQTVVLLGFNIQPARSKRIAASAAAAAAVAAQIAIVATATGDSSSNKQTPPVIAAPQTAVGGGGEPKDCKRQLYSDFLKPLPIEGVITNSKKRPRIMSLYERPYQTANDGRGGGGGGSVVGNGYMSTSRSSSSGGGGSGGAMIMSDSNDSQELTNQYYLSGNSGSGIAGNSASAAALLGNGSAINHAPSMGTLCNIGNTCYLNSVVYTLRFAPQFLHNLHHLLSDLNALQQNIARSRAKSSSLGRGISAVHMENARSWSSKDLASMEQYSSASAAGGLPNSIASSSSAATSASAASSALTQVTQKSSHQVLTEKLHELYQSLYRNEMSESTEPHHADTLLHAIQDVSTIFEGNQQQDAHEFLMCVLNSIRETSQTLIKAIAECPDVILNGYISNPDDTDRDLKHSNAVSGSGGGSSSTSSGVNMSVTAALSSLTSNSKSSSFFSRKPKRKDETKNSKNSRLQSPLKDNQIPGVNINTQSNSLFYLNANDLNSSSSASTPQASVASGVGGGGGAATASITSPSNSNSSSAAGAPGTEDIGNSSSLALLLKDKQRLEGKIRELGLDFFNEDFEGITVSTTKCLSCETVTEKKETMIDIAVPVPQAGYDSNEYMDRPSSFIQNSCITREYFRNENKYRCEQCCGYTEAIRSISYEVLPRLLIIQLSRFSGGMEKINSYIPTSFTLQCFCSKCCELSDANKLHIYKLYSVITHVGATMSVGHYIAYTCSLDWANEYINCPKEQRRRASQERAAASAGANGGGNGTALSQSAAGNSQSSSASTNALSLGSSSSSSSTTSFMKIMKFGRNKASSSGDMSKNVKQLNGLTSSSKAITNGIGKLTMNNSSGGAAVSTTTQCSTTCQSINCCAMRLTAQQQLHYLHTSQTNASDFSESDSATGYANGSSGLGYNTTSYNNNMPQPYATANSNNTSGYGSTGRGATKASYATQNHNGTEPIWYMCDDDKIKAMTQREFEELLSPARKITITPYLLFYARYNLQTASSSPPKSSSATSSSSPGPVTSSPQASWSNESLQSSGHSAHSSGMRM